MTNQLQKIGGYTFDPNMLGRARAALTQARMAGTTFASIRTGDLAELLDRLEYRGNEALQLAAECAGYRTRIEELEAQATSQPTPARVWVIEHHLWPEPRLFITDIAARLVAETWVRENAPKPLNHLAWRSIDDDGAPDVLELMGDTGAEWLPSHVYLHSIDIEGAAAAAVDEDQADEQPVAPSQTSDVQTQTVDGITVYTQPTTFSVSAVPEDPYNGMLWEVQVQYTGAYHFGQDKPENQRWAVRLRGHWCLSDLGKWDQEPIPSEREDRWLAAHRFDFATAVRLAEEASLQVQINGFTVADALSSQAARAATDEGAHSAG